MTSTADINNVFSYYGKKYRPIMHAFQKLDAVKFEYDETCYGYLELYGYCRNGNRIFANHGISNKKPYNVIVYTNYERKAFRCSTMAEAAEHILNYAS